MLHSFSTLWITAFSITILFVMCDCNKKENKASHRIEKETKKNGLGTISKSNDLTDSIIRIKPIYRLPDSVLTPEEIQWKKLYLQLILKYLVVENNRYKLELSKDSLIRLGIPAAYYDELIRSIEETNKWVEQMEIDSLSNLFERARQEAKKQVLESKK